MIKDGEIQLVFTTVDETPHRDRRLAPHPHRRRWRTASPTTPRMAGCEAAVEGMKHQDDLSVLSLQELHAELH